MVCIVHMRHELPMSTGSVVGRYVLGEPIGAGGMGVVYDAVGPTDDDTTHVAVKMLYRESLLDDRARRRFRNEAVAGRSVQHPSVMGILECGETADGQPFLVLEHVDGERLAARIERDGPLAVREALEIVAQLLAGLTAIHAAGIVHGDIKTDNILLVTGPDGRALVKVIDFGLARVQLSLSDELDPSDLEIVSGTPDYMAPEVIVGDGPTYRSDLYAVGIVLYELITGLAPFGGGTSEEIVRRHLDDHVTPPSLRCAGHCPPIVDRIVLHALEKLPEHRFASALAFHRAIGVATRSLVGDAGRTAPCGVTAVREDAQTKQWHKQLGPRSRARGSYV